MNCPLSTGAPIATRYSIDLEEPEGRGEQRVRPSTGDLIDALVDRPSWQAYRITSSVWGSGDRGSVTGAKWGIALIR